MNLPFDDGAVCPRRIWLRLATAKTAAQGWGYVKRLTLHAIPSPRQTLILRIVRVVLGRTHSQHERGAQ